MHTIGENKIRILYVSSKRAEERQALNAIKNLKHKEVQLHPRSQGIRNTISRIWRIGRLLRTWKPHALLFENAGLAASIAAFLAYAQSIPYLVRIKGDPWREKEDSQYWLPLKERIIKAKMIIKGLRKKGIIGISQIIEECVNRYQKSKNAGTLLTIKIFSNSFALCAKT